MIKSIDLARRKLSISIAVMFLLFSFVCFNPAASAEPTGSFDNGAKIFKANCAGCHVNGKNIVRRGKNLKLKALHKYHVDTEETIATLVTNGKGIMSAYGDKLTSEEIANVSAYVLQRAEANWK